MITLGIESSCDETAIAVLENGKVLSSEIASQMQSHVRFGGVVPEVAAREHLDKIAPLVESALEKAKKSVQEVELIAVTQGPGLIGPLLVGVSYAKGLAKVLSVPVVPVDHVHGHLYASLIGLDIAEHASHFPSLGLVVSGGHTNLYYMKDALSYKLLAATVDDACGESFDKVGKMLGLPYPGGPVIEKRALQGDPFAVSLPKMVAGKEKLFFSYSGLKTAVLYHLRDLGRSPKENEINDICASFQKEAFELLLRKVKRALELNPDTKSVIISGGVALSSALKKLFLESFPLPALFPEPLNCMDNAAMIAALGAELYKHAADKEKFGELDWDAYSRYDFLTYK